VKKKTDSDPRNNNQKIKESMIVAKLYKDGIIWQEMESSGMVIYVDIRKGNLIEKYKEESYEDLKGILDRLIIGILLNKGRIKIKQFENIPPREITEWGVHVPDSKGNPSSDGLVKRSDALFRKNKNKGDAE
jgi:hypothetical protein